MNLHRGHLATASVVVHEMIHALFKLPHSKRRDTIRDYLEEVVLRDVAVLPYDLRAARRHGEERARLERAGRSTPYRDAQFAAVAQVNDLILVTANENDFVGLAGLSLVNWKCSSEKSLRPSWQRTRASLW